MDKEALKKIRQNLPKGARQDIAKNFNLSPEHVAQILRGNRTNMAVVLEAVKIISVHKRQTQEAAAFLQSL